MLNLKNLINYRLKKLTQQHNQTNSVVPLYPLSKFLGSIYFRVEDYFFSASYFMIFFILYFSLGICFCGFKVNLQNRLKFKHTKFFSIIVSHFHATQCLCVGSCTTTLSKLPPFVWADVLLLRGQMLSFEVIISIEVFVSV